MLRLSTFLTPIFLFLLTASSTLHAAPPPIRVLVWDEQQPEQKRAYGDLFLGETIAAHLRTLPGLEVKTSNLAAPEQGVDEPTLDSTDVIIWWGHVRNAALTNANAERVASRVRDGHLSLIALHSAHWAKPFVRLMQDRAKADALAQVPLADRPNAQWEFLNEKTVYNAPKRDALLTPS
ncbi:MAG: trehalose utilization protein, partial [Verrucomicrobiota bacterium]